MAPTRGGTWTLDIIPAPPDIDPLGRLELLVIVGADGPRAMEPGPRPLPSDLPGAALHAAMYEPELPHLRPHVPARLRVPRSALKLAVIATATAEGIAVEVDPEASLDHIFTTGVDGEEVEAPIGAPEEQEPALMDAAARYTRLAPWRYVGDDLVFEIRRPGAPISPRFAVVIGSNGESLGLVLYHSLEEIEAVRRAAEPEEGAAPPPCVALNLEPADFAPPELLDAVEDGRYPIVGGLVPWFLSFDGEEGGPLSELEADSLLVAVQAVTAHFEAWVAAGGADLADNRRVQVGADAIDVVVHASEGAPLVGPLFAFDHLVLAMELPLSALARSPAVGAPETAASLLRNGARDPLAIVIKARKPDAVSGARILERIERVTLEVLGAGEAILLAHTVEGGLGELLRGPEEELEALARRAASSAGGLLLLISGGGVKRSTDTVRADQLIATRFVPLEMTPSARDSWRERSPFEPDERFVFEVSLDGVEPRLWRHIALSTDQSFEDLHDAIQLAVGWYDMHLYEFFRGSGRNPEILAGSPAVDDPWADEEPPSGEDVPLFSFFKDRRRRRCRYRYDFGDDWVLTVAMVRVERYSGGLARELLDGERAFPPEDSGGPWAYDRLVAVAADPARDPELAEWLNGWDPEDFDLERAKRRVDE